MSRIRVPLPPATAMSDESTGKNMTDPKKLLVRSLSSNTGTRRTVKNNEMTKILKIIP